ncbi:MAG: hypothetical protein RIQ79_2098, partial [Verrucomicrobiota bacterium]
MNSRRRLATQTVALFSLTAFTACSTIKPKPITDEQMLKQASAANVSAAKGVEPLVAPLTLDEAIARSLKYNLNQRARLIEQALALNIWKAENFDMLPRAIAAAGYSNRNNDLITRSR